MLDSAFALCQTLIEINLRHFEGLWPVVEREREPESPLLQAG